MTITYQDGYGDTLKLNKTNLNKILSSLKETKFFVKNPSQHDPSWRHEFWTCRKTVDLNKALTDDSSPRRYKLVNNPSELRIDLETCYSNWYVFKFNDFAEKNKFEAEYLAAPKYLPKYVYC